MKKLTPIILLVLLILGAISSAFTVREGQSAIVLQFGRIITADHTPGLHFKVPFIQQVEFLDNRIQSMNSEPERYFTAEKKSVDVDFYVKWRIAKTITYYRRTTGDVNQAQLRLAPIIKDALRFQVNSRDLEELISGGRSEIVQEVISQANENTLSELGIDVVDVRIKQIELPETVSESIYERMRAERKQLANELRSTGKESSERIRSEADRQSAVLIANAERDAAKVRGKGDAKAAAVYSAGYAQDIDFFEFYRSLQAYNESFAGKSNIMVMNPDSPFMRYFNDSSELDE